MKLSGKIYWKEILVRLVLMAAFFVPCALAFLPKPSDYSIRIEYDRNYQGQNTQFFWRNIGEEYSLDKTYMTLMDGSQAVIPFQEGMLGWNVEWRWDIIDVNQDVVIKAFDLYKGQEKVKSFSADELEHYIINTDDIAAAYSTGSEFVIDVTGEKSFINFGAWFTHAIVKHMVLRYGLLLIITGCLILLVVLADVLPGIKKIFAYVAEHEEKKYISAVCFALLLAGMTGIIFYDFVVGNKAFLYMGDSFSQTYPQLVHMADRIAAGDWGSGYSFLESLGNAEEAVIISLKNFCTLFGRENVAYLMGMAQMIKVFLAGMFFYFFLRQMGTDRWGSGLLGMGYAFSSYIIARGMWQSYPNEAVVFGLWLWGFELFKNGKKRWAFPLINVICYWNYHGYTAVLYTGVGIVYIVFRYFSDNKEGRKAGQLIKEIIYACGSVAIGAAIAISAWMPSLLEMLGSARVSNGVGEAGSKWVLTDLTTLDGCRTMFYRLLGNDILGMLEDSYVGLNSWLEDPAFYCGLLTVFAVPLGIAAMDKRKRRWYMIPFAGVVAYNMFGFIRYCVNGFGGAGWKLSSLWIIVVLLITAAVFWQQEVRMEKKTLRRLLAGTNVVIWVLSVLFWKKGIQIPSFVCQLLMGILLSVLLYCALTKEDGKKEYYRYLLVMGAAIEIICASWQVVNNKAVITGEALNGRVYYNDATMELLQTVKAENAFERVDKQYASVFYCDSFYQDYMGTASYIGGVGDNEYTGQLYQLWGLPTLSHVQKGAGQNAVIATLLNVRYVMLKNQEVNTYGLKYLAGKDGITLYENEYALPFGYTYDTYIKESDFMNYTPLDRRNLMMDRCVVADDDAAKAAAFMKEEGTYDILADKWAEYQRPFTVEEGHDVRFEQIQPGEIAVLALKVQGQEMLWAEGYYRQDSRIRGRFDTRIMPGAEELYIECMLEGVDNISIQASAALPYEITEASLYVIPQEEYFADYRTRSEERSRSHFNVSAFQEERIEGNARMEEKGLMVFTIPYDRHWTAYVDGEESNLLRVNTAFQGLLLEKGDHEIVLEYKTADYWWIIGLLTLAGYVIIIGLLIIREKKTND